MPRLLRSRGMPDYKHVNAEMKNCSCEHRPCRKDIAEHVEKVYIFYCNNVKGSVFYSFFWKRIQAFNNTKKTVIKH